MIGVFAGDALEVVDRELDPEVARDRDEVEDGIRRSARRRDRGDSVLERLTRDERAWRHVVADELHGEPAGLVGGRLLVAVDRGDPIRAEGRETEEVEDPRHRVRRELAAAGSGAGAGGRLELVQVLGADLARRVGADALVDVADGDLALPVQARRDRAGVEEDGGDVEAPGRHCGARIRLVAGDELDEAVEQMPARDELDRVGDHLAGDERGPHAGRTHRDAVRDCDRVELHRRAAGVADAALHVHREIALVEVARHGLDPGRADADDRLCQVLVSEAGGLQHRAGTGPVGAVGEGRALALGGIGRAIVRRGHGVPFSMG